MCILTKTCTYLQFVVLGNFVNLCIGYKSSLHFKLDIYIMNNVWPIVHNKSKTHAHTVKPIIIVGVYVRLLQAYH